MREMWDAAQENDLERAREIDAELTPVYEALSVTTNPIPLKAALEMLGLAPDRLRLPLVSADADQRARCGRRSRPPGSRWPPAEPNSKRKSD